MLINLNLNKYATGAAQPGLSVKNIAEQVIIRVPPRNAHFTIAATLDSLKSKVDRLQANYNKISQECDALKQAILRQVFE
jgi:type I restriction enzyme S subunit